MEKWSIDQGNLMSVTARKHRLGLYLNSKDKPFLWSVTQESVITNSKQLLELSCRVQELQNEVNCLKDSKDFQDAESVRSGNSHDTSRPVSFPPHPIPEGMLRHSFLTPSRREGPPSILGHTWYIGKRFCKSRCVFISTLFPRIASMEFIDRRAAPFVHGGEK